MLRVFAFAIGFALMAAWWPGIAGVATLPRWDVGALLAIPVFFGGFETQCRPTTPVHLFGAALIGWLALSLSWSASPLDGIDALVRLVVVAAALLFGGEVDRIRPFVAGAAVGLAASSVVALIQWAGWQAVESFGRIGGLFYNGDRLAAAAALVFAAAIGLRMWWAIPGLVPALVLPLSRGAWLAAGAAIIVAVWQRGKTFERFMVLAILGDLALLALMLGPHWWPSSNAERLTIWTWTFHHLDWLGHGLGSFEANPLLLQSATGATHPEHPHSEWLWLTYEGGAVGCALGLGLAVALGRCLLRSPGHLVFVALCVLACFAMPFHDPATALFAAVVAGHAARDRDLLRVAAQPRRDPLRERLPAIPARWADLW